MHDTTVMIAVPKAVWSKFKPAADERGILPSRFMLSLLKAIADDGLIDAVLDDSAPEISCAKSARSGLAVNAREVKAGSGAKVARRTERSRALQRESAPVASREARAPRAGSNPVPAKPAATPQRKHKRPPSTAPQAPRGGLRTLPRLCPQVDIPLHMRQRNVEAAIALLKRHCILVDPLDRTALIRKYRVTGIDQSLLAEQVIACAIEYGFEVIDG